MRLLLEAAIEDSEDLDLDTLAYEHVFQEEDETDFDTIFDRIIDRMRETGDVDYEAAYDEANVTYFELTGIDRTAHA